MTPPLPPAPTLVISVQSQVVFGHVGNSAALFPMQAAGLQVAAIPTVLFSNTPHYPTLRGRPLPGDFFADLLRGAEERDLPRRAGFIISGYIGSVEVARQLADFIARAKAANPGLIYLCDPVMGDSGPGLYVPEAIATVMLEDLLPLADIATPNQFELGWLTRTSIADITDLQQAAARIRLAPGARLIATGCTLRDTAPGMIESVILQDQGISRHPVAHLPIALPGTGDLFAGLIVAGCANGYDLPGAVRLAQDLTSRALIHADRLGAREVVLNDPQFRAALLKLGAAPDAAPDSKAAR